MELHLEPKWAKKDTKFKKGHRAWNAGRKGFTTDDEQKKKRMLENLEKGRRLRRVNGKGGNGGRHKVAVCAYGLDGAFVMAFQSIKDAGIALGLPRENIRNCVANKRKRCGNYQFRKADIIEFQGRSIVRKTSIEPYNRKTASEKVEQLGML